jgi:hypothetical protein
MKCCARRREALVAAAASPRDKKSHGGGLQSVRDISVQFEIVAQGKSNISSFSLVAQGEADLRRVTDALKIIRFVAIAEEAPPSPPDKAEPRPAASKRPLLKWTFFATPLLAASAYLAGVESLRIWPVQDPVTSAGPGTSIVLPQPRQLHSPPKITPDRPTKPDPSILAPSPAVVAPSSGDVDGPATHKRIKKTASATSVVLRNEPEKSAERGADSNRVLPMRAVEGASGRLVRIGRFSSASEAEQAWTRVLRRYPGMDRLKSVPVPIKSLRDGHIYYRLQVGTTSQAHSDVVCQRARELDQSCTIIGSEQGSAETPI